MLACESAWQRTLLLPKFLNRVLIFGALKPIIKDGW
jgi:hypothetical protein